MNEDKEKAWDTYVKLCKLGGTKSFLNLLKAVGLQNPFKNGTIKKVVKPLSEYLNTFDDSNM
jgi:oligoendopeptidase F